MVLRGERISNDPDLLDNLEAWAENNYDTRILHRDLSFPLLEELSNAGDLTAKKTFKEEIVKRIRSGHIKTAWFLLGEQKYLSRIKFTKEERSLIFLNNNKKLKDNNKSHFGKEIF